MIRVMMADHSEDKRSAINTYLGKQPEIRMVATAGDGNEAERLLRKTMPDVLLLGLTMPILDGFGLMQRLIDRPLPKPTKIIALSCMVKDHVIAEAMRLGAIYFVAKPFPPSRLYSYILQFANPNTQPVHTTQTLDPHRIDETLRHGGISAAAIGCRYLHAALELVSKAQFDRLDITKRVYPELARMFNTNPSNIERSIRSCIQSAWQHGLLHPIFSKRPTNSEFIIQMLEALNNSALLGGGQDPRLNAVDDLTDSPHIVTTAQPPNALHQIDD